MVTMTLAELVELQDRGAALQPRSMNGYDRWRLLAASISDTRTRDVVRDVIDGGARNAFDTICVEHARPFTDWESLFEGTMVSTMSSRDYREPGSVKDSARDWFERNGLRI
jgi:hypothetical protein